MIDFDVIVIGAGGAGLMCAMTAAQRGRGVLVIDHAKKIGEKIRISGGGRCNFTNMNVTRDHYLSQNPRFCLSALAGYSQWDFIELVSKHDITWHERELGQLFCDGSAQQIIDMFVAECEKVEVRFHLESSVTEIAEFDDGYELHTSNGLINTKALVIATGGKSIPKIGATGFGYDVAKHYGLEIIETEPALVPFTFQDDMKDAMANLAGIAVDATVSCGKKSFREAMLFTHRGISGPSVLQISSYWSPGTEIEVNLLPDVDMFDVLKTAKQETPKFNLINVVNQHLPKRLAHFRVGENYSSMKMGEVSDKILRTIAAGINQWTLLPSGTEGYRTAEVTKGGVDTKHLSSKTMECTAVPGLYFIGEVVDVTGHLGGFNFQWAWASGFAAGQHV